MAKIAFYTLGCKVNQADTASMENLFLRSGHQLVSFDGEADVYIINTALLPIPGSANRARPFTAPSARIPMR